MRLRVPRSALVGLGLIALGASSYSGIERWTSTRIVRPVHMPISLVAGHIRTGSFRLNLKTNYWVVVNPGEWWKADWGWITKVIDAARGNRAKVFLITGKTTLPQ